MGAVGLCSLDENTNHQLTNALRGYVCNTMKVCCVSHSMMLKSEKSMHIPCELDILGHDGNTLGVDGAKIGIFKEANEVSLRRLLKGKDGRSLETKVGLEVLGDLTDETLERELADQEVGTLLVTTDLTESDGSRSVSVRLLDTTGGWGRLTSSLGCELLTRSLSSGRFTSGLLGTGHDYFWKTTDFRFMRPL